MTSGALCDAPATRNYLASLGLRTRPMTEPELALMASVDHETYHHADSPPVTLANLLEWTERLPESFSAIETASSSGRDALDGSSSPTVLGYCGLIPCSDSTLAVYFFHMLRSTAPDPKGLPELGLLCMHSVAEVSRGQRCLGST
jgi:hypothetical protein